MPKTAHLQPELITFLEQLKKNNKREWFQKNKDSYDPTHPPHPGGPARAPKSSQNARIRDAMAARGVAESFTQWE